MKKFPCPAGHREPTTGRIFTCKLVGPHTTHQDGRRSRWDADHCDHIGDVDSYRTGPQIDAETLLLTSAQKRTLARADHAGRIWGVHYATAQAFVRRGIANIWYVPVDGDLQTNVELTRNGRSAVRQVA